MRRMQMWRLAPKRKEHVVFALKLLEEFDLLVRLKDDAELLVPGALPPARTQLAADAFAPEAALASPGPSLSLTSCTRSRFNSRTCAAGVRGG